MVYCITILIRIYLYNITWVKKLRSVDKLNLEHLENWKFPVFRGLFIIDDKGILRQMTINDLPVGRSVDETLRLVQAFQFADKNGEGEIMQSSGDGFSFSSSISKCWPETIHFCNIGVHGTDAVKFMSVVGMCEWMSNEPLANHRELKLSISHDLFSPSPLDNHLKYWHRLSLQLLFAPPHSSALPYHTVLPVMK